MKKTVRIVRFPCFWLVIALTRFRLSTVYEISTGPVKRADKKGPTGKRADRKKGRQEKGPTTKGPTSLKGREPKRTDNLKGRQEKGPTLENYEKFTKINKKKGSTERNLLEIMIIIFV
jgi:hypothetical protein